MLDVTRPPTTDPPRTDKLDAPIGAHVLCVEPIIEDADFDKGLFVDVSYRVHWPDGTIETGTARLDLSAKKHPSATWSFVKLVDVDGKRTNIPRPLDGAKVECEAALVGVRGKLGLRLTCGTPESLPVKRERPAKIDGVR